MYKCYSCDFIDDCFYIFNRKMFKEFKKLIFSLPEDRGDIAYYHKLHTYPISPKFSFLIETLQFFFLIPMSKLKILLSSKTRFLFYII